MKTAQTLVLAACAAIGCGTAPAEVPRAQIDALIASHDAAWNAHDPEAIVALSTQDVTLVTPSGRRVEGRDALREVVAAPGPTKQTRSTTRIDAVQVLAEGVVLIDATQTLTGPGTDQLPGIEAHVVAVAREVDGKWLFDATRPFVKPR